MRISSCVSTLMFLLCGCSASAQWTQLSANQHWYKGYVEAGLTWGEAQVRAALHNGYLATVTSATENSFIYSQFASQPQFILDGGGGFRFGPWLGGSQTAGSAEPGGGWSWVTGESWSYTNWAIGQPDNYLGTEDRLIFFAGPSDPQPSRWSDYPSDSRSLRGFIVETDCIWVEAQPQPQAACVGSNATFTFDAGGASVTREWRKNGVPLADSIHVVGSHGVTLTILGTQFSDVGIYDCVISNQCGSVTSTSASLSVCECSSQNMTRVPIYEIGTFGGSESHALGISQSGYVVGSAKIAGGSDHAFLFDGSMREIGLLPGQNLTAGAAYDVNDAGQVVGNCTGTGPTQPFLWDFFTGQLVDLEPRNLGVAMVFSINGSRVIPGAWQRPGNFIAAVNTGSGAGSIAFLPWNRCSLLWGINEAGVAVGESWSGGSCNSGNPEPFVWDGVSTTILAKLATGQTIPFDINNAGVIVGQSPNAGQQYKAVSWNLAAPQQISQLGTLGGAESRARAVNDGGTIVGDAMNSLGQYRAFVYEDGQMSDLNSQLPVNTNWTLTYADDINNDGVVVGQGVNPSGQVRGYIYNPLRVFTDPRGDVSVCVGGTASFCIAVKGVRPVTYRWQGELNQSPGTWLNISNGLYPGIGTFSGATTPTLTLSGVLPNALGRYRCMVTNACGGVASTPATLTVNTPPTISVQPGSGTVCADGSATLQVAAAGTEPEAYQWHIADATVAGGWRSITDGMLIVDGLEWGMVSGTDQAACEFTHSIESPAIDATARCVITNQCGAVTSDPATLSVCACLACSADFNLDGGIDGSDVSAFFDQWQSGHCDADVNLDGGVDGADVDTFFAAWEAGGCG